MTSIPRDACSYGSSLRSSLKVMPMLPGPPASMAALADHNSTETVSIVIATEIRILTLGLTVNGGRGGA